MSEEQNLEMYWYCKECNTERPGHLFKMSCWKCGTALKEVSSDRWHPLNMPPLERIRELAKECGYACAVHGSQERDLDVVLVAWTEEALKRNYQEVMHYIAAGLIAENGLPARVVEIEAKPLGRHACTIQMNGWYKQIDLSMAPFIAPKMTDDQAREILNIREGVDPRSWDFNYLEDSPDKPFWESGETIVLDGVFTREELLALLHFHPDNLPVGATIPWPEPKEQV
jgi:hypothetical protein